MTVKFKDHVSAQACVIVCCLIALHLFSDADNYHEQKMNNRFFDGRQVLATLFDGKVSMFRRSDRGGPVAGDEDDAGDNGDEKKRLDAFASWLEQGGSGDQLVLNQK